MNGLDIFFAVLLLWAVFNGWRRGLVRQLFSLAGVILGIWITAKYGARVGAWIPGDAIYTTPAGYVLLLLASMIGLGLLGRAVSGLFSLAGFGTLDVVLGVLLSVVKWALLAGVLCYGFVRLDPDGVVLDHKYRSGSRVFAPLSRIPERVMPFAVQAWSETAKTLDKTTRSKADRDKTTR